MEANVIVKEIAVKAPASKVWEALTDKNKMKNWFFDIEEFEPKEGFKFQFFGEKDRKIYPITCQVILAMYEKQISYTWSYDDFPAKTIVSFELFEKDGHTRVRLTHRGLDKIAAGKHDLSVESHLKGWENIMEFSLKEYLEKGETGSA